MLRGSVSFTAALSGLSFPRFEFTAPRWPEVQKISIEASRGVVQATVYFAAVATPEDGERIAESALNAALDYIAFGHQVAIAQPKCTDVNLTPMDAVPNAIYAAVGQFRIEGHATVLAVGLSIANAEVLKTALERASPWAAEMLGLFRIALVATSPVERFLLLYHILLALCPDARGEDSQREVDAFCETKSPIDGLESISN